MAGYGNNIKANQSHSGEKEEKNAGKQTWKSWNDKAITVLPSGNKLLHLITDHCVCNKARGMERQRLRVCVCVCVCPCVCAFVTL